MSDITTSIVRRQLDPYRADRFEVGLLHFADTDKKAILREWSKAEVLNSVNWLKRQNAHGWNVNIRPVSPSSLSVVDDVSAESIARMKSRGFAPAIIVETSPGNHQVWMQHGRALPPELSTAVAKDLAVGFDGDPSAASYRHFGRLAGFTNRKGKYEMENGYYPFVKLTEATGRQYTHAESYVATVEQRMQEQAREQQRIRETLRRYEKPAELRSIEEYRNRPEYRGDMHRADLAYAIYALSHGLDYGQVADAIASRDLSKKGGMAAQRDYVERTIQAAQRRAGVMVEQGLGR